MTGKRGRPKHDAHSVVLDIAEGLLSSGEISPSEAVRQAIDAAVDLGMDAGQLTRRSSTRHADASLTVGADELTPPRWPAGTLAARDTVVEQIAVKLRNKIAAKR